MYLHEEQAEDEIKKCTFGGSKFMSISANMNHRHSFLSCDDLGSCKHHRSCLEFVIESSDTNLKERWTNAGTNEETSGTFMHARGKGGRQ